MLIFGRSGLPDLTLWNPDTETVWFVEVKGPGDKLSYKQILWIRSVIGF
jgi:Fanconi-associated nuclease 1